MQNKKIFFLLLAIKYVSVTGTYDYYMLMSQLEFLDSQKTQGDANNPDLEEIAAAQKLKKLEEQMARDKSELERLRKLEAVQKKKQKASAQAQLERKQKEAKALHDKLAKAKKSAAEKQKTVAQKEIQAKLKTKSETASILAQPFIEIGVESAYKKYQEVKPTIKKAQTVASALYSGAEVLQSLFGKAQVPVSAASGKLIKIESGTLAKLSRSAKCFARPLHYGPAGESQTTQIGFSLYNKSSGEITAQVENSSLPAGKVIKKIPASTIFDLPINTSIPTNLVITDPKNSGNIKTNYQLPKNKTIYVSWGVPQAEQSEKTEPYLYPQTGFAKGLVQTTENCYSHSDEGVETNVNLDNLEPTER